MGFFSYCTTNAARMPMLYTSRQATNRTALRSTYSMFGWNARVTTRTRYLFHAPLQYPNNQRFSWHYLNTGIKVALLRHAREGKHSSVHFTITSCAIYMSDVLVHREMNYQPPSSTRSAIEFS